MADVLLVLTVITTGLSAGLLAAFAYSVLPGLTRAGAAVAVPAMQRMNVAIINPLFLVIFFGPVVFGAASIWFWRREDLLWWLVAGVVLVALGIVITMAINVPANNRLAAADVSSSAGEWAEFTSVWVRWNIVRAIATTAGFATMVVGILLR